MLVPATYEPLVTSNKPTSKVYVAVPLTYPLEIVSELRPGSSVLILNENVNECWYLVPAPVNNGPVPLEDVFTSIPV